MVENVNVSVIVTTYNSQDTVERCITSILNQTYASYEIILVDDGSNDNTSMICTEYQKKYDHICLIQQDNTGPHGARLAGTKAARAPYVVYVDSDDWIDREYLNKLVCEIESTQCDCVVTGATEVQGINELVVSNSIESGIYENESIEEKILLQALCPIAKLEQHMIMAMWGKIFRRELILESMRRINIDIRMGEDLASVLLTLLISKKVMINNSICGYYYCCNDDSLSRNYDVHFIKRSQELTRCLENAISEIGKCRLYNNIQYYKYYLCLYWVSLAIEICDKNQRKRCERDLLDFAKSKNILVWCEGIRTADITTSRIEKRILRCFETGNVEFLKMWICIQHIRRDLEGK